MPPAPNATTATYGTRTAPSNWVQRQMKKGWLRASLVGLWLVFVAAHVATDSTLAQWLDRSLHTLFFDIRGPVAAPDDVVIVAVDDESFIQAEYYRSDPERYAELAPLATTPPAAGLCHCHRAVAGGGGQGSGGGCAVFHQQQLRPCG